jgi:hypothetical protein
MFKRSPGWNTEKTGSVSWTKTRGEKRREPVPERSLQVRIERTGCRGFWPTRPRRISAIRSKRLNGLPRGEPFEHEADGRQVDEGFRSMDLQLVVFAQATLSGQPRKRACHDPSQAHRLEGALLAFGDVQSLPVTPFWLGANLTSFSLRKILLVRGCAA